MTPPRLILAVLLSALLVTGCAGLDTAAHRDLDQAALDLGDQLDAPGLLAATALLYHESEGRYPDTPFDLLGSAAARETGLQQLGLSALDVDAAADELTLRYTLLPSVEDPSERFGTITVQETDTEGSYDVGLVLERIADPDLASRALPLTREGNYAVVRASGTLCADVETVRGRALAGETVGTPPLEAGRSYTVTFTARDGAAAELREGYTVTLPR